MKILSGALSMDSGEIVVDGTPVELHSPAQAQRLGIGIIHQEFKLVPELSVAENIMLGNEPMKKGLPFIDFGEMHDVARSALAQLGEEIDPRVSIQSLPIAHRQLVEIAKAHERSSASRFRSASRQIRSRNSATNPNCPPKSRGPPKTSSTS